MSTALQAIATDIISVHLPLVDIQLGPSFYKLASNLEVLGEDFLGFAMISVRLYLISSSYRTEPGAPRAKSQKADGRGFVHEG